MAAAENNGKPVVKIFIAYPGDCKSARNSIVSIIEGEDYRWHEHFDIRLVYWEDPDQPVLGDWNTAPQKSVVQHVGDPNQKVHRLTRDQSICSTTHGTCLLEKEYCQNSDWESWCTKTTQ